jgi:hypothetical protein
VVLALLDGVAYGRSFAATPLAAEPSPPVLIAATDALSVTPELPWVTSLGPASSERARLEGAAVSARSLDATTDAGTVAFVSSRGGVVALKKTMINATSAPSAVNIRNRTLPALIILDDP